MRLIALLFAFVALCASPTAAQEASYITRDHVVRSGDLRLAAQLFAPRDREAYPVVVMVAGSGAESQLDAVYTRILAQAFAARGIATFVYDKRGVGASNGAFTGSDFEALGADAAAVARYARRLPETRGVGFWGISQAGWIIPCAAPRAGRLAFTILVSPAGVTPHEQVAFFLRTQALNWGLTVEEADRADAMHRAVALYYAGRATHADAQAEVDRWRDEPWFRGVVTHPYWDEMTPEGAVLAPDALARAQRERPEAFEIYASASSFSHYGSVYQRLRTPTLLIYGGADQLVPVARSRTAFEHAFARDRARRHDVRVYEGMSHQPRSRCPRAVSRRHDDVGARAL